MEGRSVRGLSAVVDTTWLQWRVDLCGGWVLLQIRHDYNGGSICAGAECCYRHDMITMEGRSVRGLSAVTDTTWLQWRVDLCGGWVLLQTRHDYNGGSICAGAECCYRHDMITMEGRSVRGLSAVTDTTWLQWRVDLCGGWVLLQTRHDYNGGLICAGAECCYRHDMITMEGWYVRGLSAVTDTTWLQWRVDLCGGWVLLQTRHDYNGGSICAGAECCYRHYMITMEGRSVRGLSAVVDTTWLQWRVDLCGGWVLL